jgi:hypothetical protein
MEFLKGLASILFTKKKIVGYLAAVVIAATALATGMSVQDVKEAILGAPEIKVDAPKSSPTPDPELVKALDGK